MGKKPGKKADYITFGGYEVKDVINGREVGVSLAMYNKSHYTMLPQNTGRTKRVWLGRDEEKAVVKFMALVSQLKGEKEKNVVVKIKPETVQLSAKVKGIPTPANFKDVLKNM